jgi:hypothetical protein
MNTKTITLTIVVVAVAAALALAPSLSYTGALAKKSCTTGASDNPCNGNTRDTPAATCSNPQGKPVNCNGS